MNGLLCASLGCLTQLAADWFGVGVRRFYAAIANVAFRNSVDPHFEFFGALLC
jgi:hypothetical protein